ncbi:MAG: F0F1 ATP synthase subunit A [Deltaproteobacteria bacterium]|nr:F0F1 ATP synthase subunit A [Deltaproteobacteria bacterium]
MSEPVNFFALIAHAGGRLPAVLVGTWIVMALLLIFGYTARRSLATAIDPTVPDEGFSLRHFAEAVVEWLDGFVAQVSELHGARRYVPFFGSLFLFILTANFMGLIPGLTPPTNDTDLTFALGGICFIYYLYQGFAHQGPKYLLSFFGPLWWLGWFMVVIEVLDNLFRPFSLGIRLFANMFADHHVLTLFTGLTYVLVPIAFYALGSIVCIVQALVFVILAMSYVRMAAAAH